MNAKITPKRVAILAILNILLIILIAYLSNIKNYYDYFTGAFVGVVLVLSVSWVIIVVKNIKKK